MKIRKNGQRNEAILPPESTGPFSMNLVFALNNWNSKCLRPADPEPDKAGLRLCLTQPAVTPPTLPPCIVNSLSWVNNSEAPRDAQKSFYGQDPANKKRKLTLISRLVQQGQKSPRDPLG